MLVPANKPKPRLFMTISLPFFVELVLDFVMYTVTNSLQQLTGRSISSVSVHLGGRAIPGFTGIAIASRVAPSVRASRRHRLRIVVGCRFRREVIGQVEGRIRERAAGRDI